MAISHWPLAFLAVKLIHNFIHMRTGIFLVLFFITFYSHAQVNIIPQPASIQMGKGVFNFSKNTVIVVTNDADRKTAELFNDYLQEHFMFKLDIDRQESRNYIRINTKQFIQAPDKDAYTLDVNAEGISIEGDTHAGTFYGMQTLIQLLPVENKTAGGLKKWTIPQMKITDAPRFKYRGMHLDVTRHIFPLSFIKKYIDYLAYHKFNYFHWHLTDDQGWRIEIKKYPELQKEAAYRNGTIIGRYPGTANDDKRYGGYFTQEEVKEVVRYAAERHITVMPEIEMPGHASAAIAAFPSLSCFPGKPTVIPSHPSAESKRQQAEGKIKLVQETWGVFEDVFCAGKDSTFLFLQDVIDEVLTLFPSKYIHIGGDESPKVHWKLCPDCQARIKKEKLKDEHELQSWFVQRMEKYINAKGRTIVGWDEILEGGLAPNAIVMSWRGEEGGIDAAKQDHFVIMTPQKPLYFDHTQSRNEDSLVIGGYNPLEAVYAYDPVPKLLPAGKAKYILGAQANLWTEYIPYTTKVEYKIFPRMSALSEVLWTPAAKKSWRAFEQKIPYQIKRYQMWGARFSNEYYAARTGFSPTSNFSGVGWTFEHPQGPYRVTLIRSSENKKDTIKQLIPARSSATKPYRITVPVLAGGQYQVEGWSTDLVPKKLFSASQNFEFSKSTGKKASITKRPNEKYPGQNGAYSLVNGIYSNKGLSYPDWLGWIGDDMVATIDLGKITSFDSVRIHTLDQNGSWVYLPKYVEVLVSNDGKKFTSVGRSTQFRNEHLTMGWINVSTKAKKARYVRVIAKNYGLIPAGQPGAGTRAWLFCDEIQVY